ncbi:MAG TPA: hypothetical protein VK116_00265, partial [Planctomycetota bacterium]|nr:hypothetical protein [Planctomycetota bacterium]
MVALLAWAARDDVRAQLVITEDTTITEVVPGGIHIEGDATVRIAPGGRVEGDITGDNPGLTTPRVVVEGGVVDGNIGDPFPGSVRIVSGLVTGDVVVIVFSVSIEGGVVLGRVDGLSADVLISGGFVGEALVSDFPLDVRGGTIRQVAGDSVLLSGGRVLDGIHIVPAIAGATTVVKGIDIEITDETIRGRLLDGSDLGEGQPFTLLDDAPLEIVNHPNALYAVPSAPIVGSCTGLDVTVFLAAECEAEGLSFGLAHDSDELVPVSVEQGAAL